MSAFRYLLALIVMLAAAAPARAEEPVYKLISITWSVQDHKLRWDIAQGHQDENGKFVIDKLLDQCEIDPDAATMTVAGETRQFSEEEAAALHRILDVLAQYSAESYIWWLDGQGEKVKPKGTVARARRPEPVRASRQIGSAR